MKSRGISEVRIEAKELLERRVTNKAALIAALPILIELEQSVKSAKHIYDISKEVLTDLCDACAEYALEHESVFDDGHLVTDPKGVRKGEITIDDVVYHLASGYDSPKRIDGDPLTQDFLAALPKDWAKANWKIDTTGLNRLGVSEEDLEEQGLYRPAKNSWCANELMA